MSLPVIAAPLYEVKLFSQPKPVVFRPYVVKEEKMLLMAQDGNDRKEVERNVKQVITNCTFGKVNVERLPLFDIEYMFVQLRSKSVNNIVTQIFECRNNVGEKSKSEDHLCHAHVPVTINLDDIQLTVPEGHTDTFMLDDRVGVTLRYPTAELFDAYVLGEEVQLVDMLVKCLNTIFTTDGEVHECSESTPAEVQDFIDKLTVGQTEKMAVFFDTMPHLEYKFAFKCPSCEYTEQITLSGLMDFFG